MIPSGIPNTTAHNIASPPSFDRLNTTRRSFTLLTSVSGGTESGLRSVPRYVYSNISSSNDCGAVDRCPYISA